MILAYIVTITSGSGFGVDAPTAMGLIMPVAVLFLSLLPPARTWFNR